MVSKNELTKEGYKKLERELRQLIDVDREKVKVQLAEARAQGDLSENADYDAARDKQAIVEARIKEIENILNNSVIIDENKKNANKVALGSEVTIRFLESGKEATYKIVGTVESDPIHGLISNACALGEAIVGKQTNDIVDVKAIKNYKVQIIKIA